MMPRKLATAIEEVLDYFYVDELRNQREADPHLGVLDASHIAEALGVLAEAVKWPEDDQ